MNGRADTQGAIRQMQRIVALLTALADLAERAAGRSPAVRLLVLWLLARAEAVASDHVLAVSGLPACAHWAGHTAACPDADHAIRLAARFRLLAAALAAFAEALGWTWQANRRHTSATLRLSPGSLSSPAALSTAIARLDSS